MADIQRLQDLFAAARRLPVGEVRDSFLQDVCSGDEELRRQLEVLLRFEVDTQAALDATDESDSTTASVSGDASSSRVDEFVRELKEQTPRTSRYVVRGEVARGGMGVILRVHDQGLRRDLAMKVVLGQDAADSKDQIGSKPHPVTLGRFVEEAQVTGMLDHPGIVPVHELGVDAAGRVFFTMRLVHGRTLQSVFKRMRHGEDEWTRTRVLGVLLKACEAVAYAHDHGVVHRDLKPANIMVGKYGEVYVMDWGLARVKGRDAGDDPLRDPEAASTVRSLRTLRRDDGEDLPDSPLQTADGMIMGTPEYMSPEQARGDIQAIGPRTDVYCLGVMLYELLTGRTPFKPPDARRSPHMIVMAVQEETPRPVHELAPDAPAELVSICERAMARKPDDRYADMTELAADLRAFLEQRVVKAYETGALAELRKWVQRNKGLAAALLVSFVLAVSASGVFAWLNERLGVALAHESELSSELQVSLSETELQRERADQKAAEATENARVAESNAEQARIEKANVLRLSAFQDLEDLEAEADTLWPPLPERIAAYDAWLARADALVAGLHAGPDGRAGGYAEQLAAMRQRGRPITAEEASQRGDASLAGTLAFPTTEERWWHDQLAELVEQLRAFADPVVGLVDGVDPVHGLGIRPRRAFAETVVERTLTGADARRRWFVAIATIADEDECPWYEGLELTPQVGLLPIGQDRDTGLFEFWHVLSGDEPARDAAGRLVMTETSGMVLVLVPGGTFWMGAQSTDPDGRQFDPLARVIEAPVIPVRLSPFFLSKFEMSQGQWVAALGSNPSHYRGDASVEELGAPGGRDTTMLHPVERVSWDDCMRLLPRIDVTLPTEAQWEHAARAGTSTRWFTGDDRESLREPLAVNLADQAAGRWYAGWDAIDDWPELDDGWIIHCPVDGMRPNAFGLHHVHGNVDEWCRDSFQALQHRPLAWLEALGLPAFQRGALLDDDRSTLPHFTREELAALEHAEPLLDPVFLAESGGRICRGGDFRDDAAHARSSARGYFTTDYRHYSLGLRPARGIDDFDRLAWAEEQRSRHPVASPPTPERDEAPDAPSTEELPADDGPSDGAQRFVVVFDRPGSAVGTRWAYEGEASTVVSSALRIDGVEQPGTRQETRAELRATYEVLAKERDQIVDARLTSAEGVLVGEDGTRTVIPPGSTIRMRAVNGAYVFTQESAAPTLSEQELAPLAGLFEVGDASVATSDDTYSPPAPQAVGSAWPLRMQAILQQSADSGFAFGSGDGEGRLAAVLADGGVECMDVEVSFRLEGLQAPAWLAVDEAWMAATERYRLPVDTSLPGTSLERDVEVFMVAGPADEAGRESTRFTMRYRAVFTPLP